MSEIILAEILAGNRFGIGGLVMIKFNRQPLSETKALYVAPNCMTISQE